MYFFKIVGEKKTTVSVSLISGNRSGNSERYKSLFEDNHQHGKKMIMIVKTPGSQMGSPGGAEEGGEEVGGGRWESGERSEV